jgi:hypothetical protein
MAFSKKRWPQVRSSHFFYCVSFRKAGVGEGGGEGRVFCQTGKDAAFFPQSKKKNFGRCELRCVFFSLMLVEVAGVQATGRSATEASDHDLGLLRVHPTAGCFSSTQPQLFPASDA